MTRWINVQLNNRTWTSRQIGDEYAQYLNSGRETQYWKAVLAANQASGRWNVNPELGIVEIRMGWLNGKYVADQRFSAMKFEARAKRVFPSAVDAAVGPARQFTKRTGGMAAQTVEALEVAQATLGAKADRGVKPTAVSTKARSITPAGANVPDREPAGRSPTAMIAVGLGAAAAAALVWRGS